MDQPEALSVQASETGPDSMPDSMPVPVPVPVPVADAQVEADEAERRAVFTSATRWTTALMALTVATVGLTAALPRLLSKELAKGKPWRASSSYVECYPEDFACGSGRPSTGRTGIFFHTKDDHQPWVEFDLGAPTRFSEVVVHNRRDGNQFVLDRAVPLILEVGDDQQTWRVLAQRGQSFAVWTARFEPTTARFVRLRSPRTTMLHLEAVEVYP